MLFRSMHRRGAFSCYRVWPWRSPSFFPGLPEFYASPASVSGTLVCARLSRTRFGPWAPPWRPQSPAASTGVRRRFCRTGFQGRVDVAGRGRSISRWTLSSPRPLLSRDSNVGRWICYQRPWCSHVALRVDCFQFCKS